MALGGGATKDYISLIVLLFRSRGLLRIRFRMCLKASRLSRLPSSKEVNMFLRRLLIVCIDLQLFSIQLEFSFFWGKCGVPLELA